MATGKGKMEKKESEKTKKVIPVHVHSKGKRAAAEKAGEEVVIDANEAIAGRLASKVAKILLNGKRVRVVNAEKAIFSGNPKRLVEKYIQCRNLKSKQNPEKSPKWPKVPNLFLRRLIRGMLPRKKAVGRAAFKRLRVYVGNPLREPGESLKEAKPSESIERFMTLGELCKHLGWKGNKATSAAGVKPSS